MTSFELEDFDNYLAHHGIKGQKWGIRRYQNPDGSLTEEGRRRYAREIISTSKKADAEYDRLRKKGYVYQQSQRLRKLRKKEYDLQNAVYASSKECRSIAEKAAELQKQEDEDWRDFVKDKTKMKETARSYLREKGIKEDPDKFVKNITDDDLDPLFSYYQSKNPSMRKRQETLDSLYYEFKKASDKLLEDMLNAYGQDKVQDSLDTTPIEIMFGDKALDSFFRYRFGDYKFK